MYNCLACCTQQSVIGFHGFTGIDVVAGIHSQFLILFLNTGTAGWNRILECDNQCARRLKSGTQGQGGVIRDRNVESAWVSVTMAGKGMAG